MNLVTIKLPVEKDETRDEALQNFHENVVKLIHNEVEYEPEAIYNSSDNEVFVGLKLSDNDLKVLLDAAPGNTFEIIDVHWPHFLEEKTQNGAAVFKIEKMET